MNFQIKIADRIVEIHSIYNYVFELCHDYILPNNCWRVPDITIQCSIPNIDDEFCNKFIDENDYKAGLAESINVYREIAEKMLYYDTFLMHGSVVITNGLCYMITAASGVGKSIRTEKWIRTISGSDIVNGDKPLIRVFNDAIYAYGTPWCGKEGWNRNVSGPLRAIFLLERAVEGEENSIRELRISDAFASILPQIYCPANVEYMHKTLELIKRLDKKVFFYQFRSFPTPEAVKLAYDEARPK